MAQSAPTSGPAPRDQRSFRRAAETRADRPFGLKLGTLFGVRITMDYSMLVIAALVTTNLGAGLLPSWHPDWSPWLVWTLAIVAALLFFASVLVHELSHALVGRKVGVPMSGITLFMFGGMAHMEREPERPKAEFLMAVVGPVTSVAIGVAATLAGAWLSGPALSQEGVEGVRRVGPLATLLLWLGPINVLLGVFNLIPGFPLDGGRVLRAILWWSTGSFQKATRWASLSGRAIAWLFIGAGVLMMLGRQIPFFGSGLVQGLWLILIGWFLNNAAKMSQQQSVLMGVLEGVSVSRLLFRYAETVDPGTTVLALVQERLLHAKQRCFPVVSSHEFSGLVCVKDVRRVPESAWAVTPVRDVMTPAARVEVLAPHEEASRALHLFGEREVDLIPVVERGELVGVVRREDLLRWISLRGGDDRHPFGAR